MVAVLFFFVSLNDEVRGKLTFSLMTNWECVGGVDVAIIYYGNTWMWKTWTKYGVNVMGQRISSVVNDLFPSGWVWVGNKRVTRKSVEKLVTRLLDVLDGLCTIPWELLTFCAHLLTSVWMWNIIYEAAISSFLLAADQTANTRVSLSASLNPANSYKK